MPAVLSKVCFAGSSHLCRLTGELKRELQIGRSDTFTNISRGGWTAAELLTYVEHENFNSAHDIQNMILMVGGNDVDRANYPPEGQPGRHIKKICELLINQNIRPWVIQILPRRKINRSGITKACYHRRAENANRYLFRHVRPFLLRLPKLCNWEGSLGYDGIHIDDYHKEDICKRIVQQIKSRL